MSAVPLLSPALLATAPWSAQHDLLLPSPGLAELPIRAVQFGTGAFLRGFVDCFLDEANRRGQFNGRVVAIGSTGSRRDELLNCQHGLYTLISQGLVNGQVQRDVRVVGSVERALSATLEWEAVLALARLPLLEFIFSNSSEVGIVLDDTDDLSSNPPRSFPGKLTRFLFERATATDFDRTRGLVVLPCELIERNGDRLRDIVVDLASRAAFGDAFRNWVNDAVHFCNTLVDRIVPGAPIGEEAARWQETLGYVDHMITTCEPYALFAIQGSRDLERRLSFANANPGVIVTDDIAPYAERKVRLLNGTHTMTAPLALLCGAETVREAVEDDMIGSFMRRALFDEIVPTLPAMDAESFADDVLERFANPFISHALLDITLHGTTKWRVRIAPTMVRHVKRTGQAPAALAFAFAAHLLYSRGDLQRTLREGGVTVPLDTDGEAVRAAWNGIDPADDDAITAMVWRVAGNATLWDSDLSLLPRFCDRVTAALLHMMRSDVPTALRSFMASAEVVQ